MTVTAEDEAPDNDADDPDDVTLTHAVDGRATQTTLTMEVDDVTVTIVDDDTQQR